MTIRDDILLLKHTRDDNLVFLKTKINEKRLEYRNLKNLYTKHQEFGFSEAIDILEDENKTYDVIDDTNLAEKLAE